MSINLVIMCFTINLCIFENLTKLAESGQNFQKFSNFPNLSFFQISENGVKLTSFNRTRQV